MPKLEPLPVITCTSSDCKNDLHCFKATQSMKKNNAEGHCRSCNVELIDWPRVHQMNFSDVEHTFQALSKEMVRHHFWHIEIDQKAINHALRKGRNGLIVDINHRIEKYISPSIPPRDGRQTPRAGNIIYYAQHATACCCRRCIEYWHGVAYGRELTLAEKTYFSGLCLKYVDIRMPDLPAMGQKVPNLRQLGAMSST